MPTFTDQTVIDTIARAQHDLVPAEGPSRPIVRLRHILAGAYDLDSPHDDGEQPIIDLLTDVLHWCSQEGIDIHDAMERAVEMRDIERKEWADA
jgi:hypothetical protein